MTPLKPMLAKDAVLDKITWPRVVQPKLDGIRVHIQDGIALTRTLKRVPNREVQAVLGRPEFEGLDGEIIVGSPTAEDVYRQTTSFVMSESKKTRAEWTFFVFDAITGCEGRPYEDRRQTLQDQTILWHVAEPNHIALVAEQYADSAAEMERMEALMVDQGYEGVILRDPNGLYKHGRSTPTGPLLKVKRFVDFECVVLDVFEENHNANERFTNELGRGARSTAKAGLVGKGRLGGLIVSPVDDSVVPSDTIFRVGTGFDQAERKSLWAVVETTKSPDSPAGDLEGWTVKIKSFPVGVKDKPRHPVFLGGRDLELDS